MITLSSLLIGIGIVLAGAVLVLFPQARILFKGIVGVFIQDAAKTPEGAAAVYQQEIDKAQDNYVKANNTYQRVAGQLDSAQRSLVASQAELKRVEAACEDFARRGKDQELQLYCEKREEIMDEINRTAEVIKALTTSCKEAEFISNEMEKRLATLKKEKNKVINDLQTNRQLKDIYDSMDELKASTHADKLLESVREGAKEAREEAVGARVVHNNKVSTKVSVADAEAKKVQSNNYMEELKKKYPVRQ